MRLLKTDIIELHEYIDAELPPYAILSHRWEGGEVTLQQLQDGRGLEMAGYDKIVKSCAQAAKDGWEFVWIDTCCIDKTSSAELSEAINSMYRWYQNSQVCYAYLSDVPDATANHSKRESSFQRSKWFTRGWTLQELLAPTFVEFYDQEWTEIGTKSSMREIVQRITGISSLIDVDDACVAEKLSWAARRVTSRVEDQAYCLMGLFDINMPLIYGEGKNAFFRLQLEIWSRTNDESMFTWSLPSPLPVLGGEPKPVINPVSSLLASEPSQFEGLNGIRTFGESWSQNLPEFLSGANLVDVITLTHRGTRLDLRSQVYPVIPVISKNIEEADSPVKEFLLPLKCGCNYKDNIQGIFFFALHLFQSPELTWSRDARLELVNAEDIKEMTRGSDQILIYLPHFSVKVEAWRANSGHIPDVLFDTASLSAHGFRVSEGFCEIFPPSHKSLEWKNTETMGILLSLEVPFSKYFSSYVVCAALRISPPRLKSTDIVLLYEYKVFFNGRASSAISLLSLPESEALDGWIQTRQLQGLSGMFRDKSDRSSWPLGDGKYISAMIKSAFHSEKPIFRIKITINEGEE